MSKAVVIKDRPCEVAGQLVKVDEECRLPDGLADSMEAKGLCVVLTDGVRADAAADDHEVERHTPAAKKAVKDALVAKKNRADAAAKVKAPKKKAIPKKKAAK